MQLEHAKYLYDIQYASGLLADFVQGKTWPDYEANAMLRAAVERQFEIIGEALNQLSKLDTAVAARIPDLAQIVAFRNQLIHGYATVNVSTVWNISQTALPALRDAVQGLLDELG